MAKYTVRENLHTGKGGGYQMLSGKLDPFGMIHRGAVVEIADPKKFEKVIKSGALVAGDKADDIKKELEAEAAARAKEIEKAKAKATPK